MGDQNVLWVMLLLGAGLTTWVIVDHVAHIRDNAGPALNEIGRDVEVDVAEGMLRRARQSVQSAGRSDPFDPEQARRARAAARWALEDAAEAMKQATPEQRRRLAEEAEKLRREVDALRHRMEGSASSGD
jgi:DNA polymerase III delta prime subunit